ncbi:hypothetical protein FRC11_010744 [Ceratobasidium sp. 423]|nr:hypothetical protein FRC11_010744 [Ceratobasidium sp. 423]
MQSILEPTDDDVKTTEVLLDAMRDGPEHEIQRGMLDAILAGEARFHRQERLRLATAPAKVDFSLENHRPYYELMIGFCNRHNPVDDVVFYGRGRRPRHGHPVRIHPANSTVSYPHFTRYGIRYGVAGHHRGNKARYGYIYGRVPVVIRGIYETTVELHGQEHKFLAVMVQRFVAPEPEPVFPWDHWREFLGIDAWEHNEFDPLESVPVTAFSGVFALSDMIMPVGHLWLTFAILKTRPEDLADDHDDE